MSLWSVVKRAIAIGMMSALPALAYAQEATISGTITDSTGGVLPGVTVVAMNEATGNTFQGVTDDGGRYRIAVRTGRYRITAELSGFATVTRTGLEILLSQQAIVHLQMAPSGLQESVTVTGEAPLVDVSQTRAAGNIDPRQMQELPVNGRNWQNLTLLAPGSRANAVEDAPVGRESGNYQINLDGQQVTQNITSSSFSQARFSRDAIAEFEFVTNRFDASQGRSSGVQVNVITKSGTNTPSGTLSGYFRNDRLNAADFVVHRVLPYSDQQIATTFGGPVRKDRMHFFGSYEYERQPQTFTYTTPYPRFNLDLTGVNRDHKGNVRVDTQFTSQTRLAVRWSIWRSVQPYKPANVGGSTRTPSSALGTDKPSDNVFGTLTQILNNRALNELKAGYSLIGWDEYPYTQYGPNHPMASLGVTSGGPGITLVGLAAGGGNMQNEMQRAYSVRDDFTYSYNMKGRHDLKAGGEYLYFRTQILICSGCLGTLDAQAGPVPANIGDLFPDLFDVRTWNLAPLSPLSRRWTQALGTFEQNPNRHTSAMWLQDDWALSPRLTLNLGLRYDLQIGALAETRVLEPFLPKPRRSDSNNLAPRFGFGYSVNDRTVLRGGVGKYFGEITSNYVQFTDRNIGQFTVDVLNDRRPDFAANPFNGIPPTFEEAKRLACTSASPVTDTTCLRRGTQLTIASPTAQIPYSYQTSIGMQRQIGATMAIEGDYVFKGARKERFSRNINLSYDPVAGVNYPSTNIGRRPYPEWGIVSMALTEGWSNDHSLQTVFTKRMSRGWQASATYTLAGFRDAEPSPAPFAVASDLGGEYTLAVTDQRHRASFSGIWQTKGGFQFSGVYFFGSGERFATTWGGDGRATADARGARLRPNGTVVPRNNFVGSPIHRVDVRAQRRFALRGRAGIDGMLEVYNLFNHANYGSYTTLESNANYGRPSQNINIAYQPRMLQLGLRFSF